MASTQQIRGRIRSVKNTRQITKAMELVAASKMRRAQEATLRSRAYRNTAREILTRLSELVDVSKFELYAQRPVKGRLYVVITSDRGLAGAYNSNVLRRFAAELQADQASGIASKAILVGRKSEIFARRITGLDLLGAYDSFPDQPTSADLQPIIEAASQAFLGGLVDVVDVLYTDFKSSIAQEVTLQRIFPVSFQPTDSEERDLEEAVFEPSPKEVLEQVTPRLLEVQLLQAFLESSASEHSMRMLAMKNASDNAGDLIDDLTLVYNGARQAAITQELAEITGGAAAIQ